MQSDCGNIAIPLHRQTKEKPGGELLACFYIAGEQRVADWLAKTVMTRMGWFTPPFDTANDVRQRLEPYYDIFDFHVEGAMLYFKVRKR